MKNITWRTLVKIIKEKTDYHFCAQPESNTIRPMSRTLMFCNNNYEMIIYWYKNNRMENSKYNLEISIIPIKTRTKMKHIYHTRAKGKNKLYRNFLNDLAKGRISGMIKNEE